jgi:hypothetical protein
MHSISPNQVLRQIAESISPKDRGSIIVVGSLAAGYYFFRETTDACAPC